ncbi:MAG: relaxase/mobilization nuclease domain-containing protein [Chitinophagaceae bacterium]
MVAVINASSSLRNTLHYNENKLKQGAAKLIHSSSFGKDTELLRFSDKIKTLQNLASLNERTKINSVHISLNFDPSEKHDAEMLAKIADTYMQKIGFGAQPYLVYEHHDAGHPHIHIVSTNIQRDGSRIKLHNIGRNQSEKARKEIEIEFKLVKAQRQQLKQAYELKPVKIGRIQFGKSETKRSITNILDAVLPTYKYTSIHELNAVLKLYNIVADRGGENSRTFKNNGLVYRILDDKGQKVGIPIKASDLYNKPGLKFLEQKFVQNEPLKQPHKQRVKNAIDLSFIKHKGQSLEEMMIALQKEKIKVVLRQNDNGIIYGITYLDHQAKCVFNGSDLGKQYSSNAIQLRCNQDQTIKQEITPKQKQTIRQQFPDKNKASSELNFPTGNILFKELMQPGNEGALASELQENVRQSKRKKLRNS